MTPAQLASLKSEIQNDSAGIGYGGKSHEDIADLVNKPQRSLNRSDIPAGVLASCLDPVEFNNLSTSNKSYIQMLTAAGTLTVTAAMRQDLRTIFASAPKTLARLNDAVSRQGSRGEELNLGRITASDVADALRT